MMHARKFSPGLPADCGFQSYFHSAAGLSVRPSENYSAKRSFPVSCGPAPVSDTPLPADCGKSQAQPSVRTISRAQSNLRDQNITPKLDFRSRLEDFPAAGSKQTRSRLEEGPQSTGSNGPQSVGARSAADWKFIRSGLEKKCVNHRWFQGFAVSHRFLACFTGFAS